MFYLKIWEFWEFWEFMTSPNFFISSPFSFLKIADFCDQHHSVAHPGGCVFFFLVQLNTRAQRIVVIFVLCVNKDNDKIWKKTSDRHKE